MRVGSGGSADRSLPLGKRIGLRASDGAPTDLYRRFKNPVQAGAAMSQAIRKGYGDLFRRNEFVHKMEKKGLEGLVREATGLEAKSNTLRAIVNSFLALKEFADFEAAEEGIAQDEQEPETPEIRREDGQSKDAPVRFSYHHHSEPTEHQ